MKKIILFSLLILTSLTFLSFNSLDKQATSTFKLLNTDAKFSIEFCQNAISEANWCGFRYKTKRNLIQFDTGLKVELFSQDEIGETNSNCTLTDYRDFSKDVWRFTPEGKIIHLVSKTTKK
jgi:hypothetical protein